MIRNLEIGEKLIATRSIWGAGFYIINGNIYTVTNTSLTSFSIRDENNRTIIRRFSVNCLDIKSKYYTFMTKNMVRMKKIKSLSL